MILLVLLLALTPLSDEKVEIHWGEKTLSLDKLPPELPASAREALELWGGYAAEVGYRLDLDPTGRVLLVTRAKNSGIEKQMQLACAVIERFDRELPAPPQRRTAAPPALVAKAPVEPAPKKSDHTPLPEDPEDAEDPEGGAHPWKLEPRPADPPRANATVTTTSWGAKDAPLDTQTAVLLVVEDELHFGVLLQSLGKAFPHLEAWTKEAGALQGFVLGNPLAGAYLESHPSLEEWNPDHELVSRLARLSLLRRFGELPNWFVQGYAWHMEIALQGAVYCFPWRDEFVWEVEHTAWPKEVEKRYERMRVKAEHFLGWRRGKYKGEEAQASWGVTEYLVAREAPKLPDLLDELRTYREEHSRLQDDPSSWRRDVDYEIPFAEQQRLMVAHLGPEYLERVTSYLRQELDP